MRAAASPPASSNKTARTESVPKSTPMKKGPDATTFLPNRAADLRGPVVYFKRWCATLRKAATTSFTSSSVMLEPIMSSPDRDARSLHAGRPPRL